MSGAMQTDGEKKNGSKTGTAAFLLLSLEALGVVFGDIGTSPLYSMKVCFSEGYGLEVTRANVLGIISMIFWALTLTVTVKYLLFILRADNNGQGGEIALMALCMNKVSKSKATVVMFLGLFGASLLYGDGVITPAISVLSAVEGLGIYAPKMSHFIIPITVAVLLALFVFQKKGTGGVGKVFGPVMIVWFLSIGILGLRALVKDPEIILAVNPVHAAKFFMNNGIASFFVIGAVFLSVTGAEALYADIGHFGKSPIKFNWFLLVFPSLILNYFGQGANLLVNPKAADNPFYHLAPAPLILPLVILSTFATIIASQAVISGAFSLTRQAVQLGYLPRLSIKHTSESERGQIYVPAVNWMLMVATIALVLAFRNSDNLAAAYGIAVTTSMLITTLLYYRLTSFVWNWNPFLTLFMTTIFIIPDSAFFLANIVKVEKGGYLPLLIGILIFFVMRTWKKGRKLLLSKLQESTLTWEQLIHSVENSNIQRVPGVAVFLSGNPKGVPVALLHNFKHNYVIHETVITLTITTTDQPKVKNKDERIEVNEIAPHIYSVIARYGFMETPNVPKLLDQLPSKGLMVDKDKTTYFLGRETLVAGKGKGLMIWEKPVFSFLSKNATSATAYFSLPANRVVELGSLITI
ncbi:MAG TPA: potassium transporter Kup [Acidobacteriota bacterium]|jgi:KUP system potassium uptake protein|nr:potassium transporter Kup [Acidobacteriota bacterium]HQQ47342.1 potassium transporter Kup [Acidobacteriota bacterium]